MKKVFNLFLCVLALGLAVPQGAWAQKKAKREKAPYEWKLPELTGNKDFDEYLLKCDTMNTTIRQYCDNITFYEVAEIVVVDESGEKDIRYHVVDAEGNLRSANKAFQQNLDLVLSGTSIITDMALMATFTASASLALPSLGMKALSYGKYVKAGPKIIEQGGKEIKKIVKRARAQARQIQALKKGNIDDVKALNAEVNADVDTGSATLRQIEMKAAEYEAKIGPINEADKEPIDAAVPEEEG